MCLLNPSPILVGLKHHLKHDKRCRPLAFKPFSDFGWIETKSCPDEHNLMKTFKPFSAFGWIETRSSFFSYLYHASATFKPFSEFRWIETESEQLLL